MNKISSIFWLSLVSLILATTVQVHGGKSDSTFVTKAIAKEHIRLVKGNDSLDLIDLSDLGQYIAELDNNQEGDEGVWIKEYASDEKERLIKRKTVFDRLNKRLQEFNNSRKHEDSLHIYVVIASGFKAYLKNNMEVPSGTPLRGGELKAFFDESEMKNVIDQLTVKFPYMMKEAHQLLAAQDIENRIVLGFQTFSYYTTNFEESYYMLDMLSAAGKFQEEELEKRIASKAKQMLKKKPTVDERIEMTIENVIAAISIVERKENISKKGIVSCNKPITDLINKTWPPKELEYRKEVEGMADMLKNGSERNQLGSPYILADNPATLAALPDKVFIKEILPDKLRLLADQEKEKRSDYTIYVLFKEVNFVIPLNERMEFAKAVFEASTASMVNNMICIVVPYYRCADVNEYTNTENGPVRNPDYDKVLLMPSAYGSDSQLNTRMNIALIREESFRSGFEQAFKWVPKDLTAYFGYLMWDGSLVFKEVTEKRVAKSSNFYDVFILVDSRLDRMEKFLDCEKAKHKIRTDREGFTYGEEAYFDCLARSDLGIKGILAESPEPTFNKELNAKVCTLRQSKLAEPGGDELAMRYVMASIGFSGKKFWNVSAGKEAKYDEEDMDTKLFYGNKNPVKSKFWLLTALDLASFAASFVGLDFIFDITQGVVCIMIEDHEGAAIAFASVFVPAGFAMAAKGLNPFKILKAGALMAYAKGRSILVRRANKLVEMEIDVANLGSSLAGDGVDVLRIAGVHNEKILALARTEPALNDALEESMVLLEEDMIKKRPSVPGDKYSPDEISNRLNRDPGLAIRYRDYKKNRPVGFIQYLKNIDNSPKVARLGRFTLDLPLKDEENYFTLFVHEVKAGGRVSDADGNLLDASAVGEWMEKNGYQPGGQIKVVSVVQTNVKDAEKLADELAEKYITTAKIPGKETTITKEGELLAKDGSSLSWVVKDYTNLAKAIPKPQGVVIKVENPDYIIYVTAQGKERIRFRASKSETLQYANPGRNYTADADAALSTEGKVFVLEGRHRAIGSAHGDEIPEELGGVAPDILDFEFTSKFKPDPGVKVADLKIDYSQPDVLLSEAKVIRALRNFGKLDNALYTVLKGKVNKLDNVLKLQFLDDFANASDDVLKKLQDDNLFDVWKNDIRSADIAELLLYKSKGNLRNEYITAVNAIADKATELKALGKNDVEIAQEVFNLRRQTTINFKAATPDDMLDIIYEFNNIRYTQTGLGDKWGLSWNGALTKATKNGVTDYFKIISGASTPLGDKQLLGKALYDVVGSKTLPVLQKYRMTSLIP
jgi:hypothetical protein